MERNRNVVVDFMVVGKPRKCREVVVKKILALVVSVEGR